MNTKEIKRYAFKIESLLTKEPSNEAGDSKNTIVLDKEQVVKHKTIPNQPTKASYNSYPEPFVPYSNVLKKDSV